MTDKELIAKHIEQIDEALEVLERHRSVTVSDLQRSVELRWTVERGLQIVMQSVFDIGAHLLASAGKNDWDDYTTLIDKLGVHGVVPKAFAQRFKAMAGFRNVLVHEYLETDLSIVEQVMKEELNSFRQFVSYVMEYMEKSR